VLTRGGRSDARRRTALRSTRATSSALGQGMSNDEAVALLDELNCHAMQEKYPLPLKYRVVNVMI